MERRGLRNALVAAALVSVAVVFYSAPVTMAAGATQNYIIDSLPTLPSFTNARANGINASGQIIGDNFSDSGHQVAVFWASSTTNPPTTLPSGRFAGNAALGISDTGRIVGIGQTNIGQTPLLWASSTASPTELQLGTFQGARPSGINNAGQIVGEGATPASFAEQAVLWPSPTAAPVALPTQGFSHTSARGINDAGQIVGSGLTSANALLFLHVQGAALILDSNSATKTTASSRDSAALKFARGNPWQPIGTWAQAATGETQTFANVRDLKVWLGLKNSDDQGTRFDLRAEILRNGVGIASGEVHCISGITRNPTSALETSVPFGAVNDGRLGPTDALSLRLSARIGTAANGAFCGGHTNASGLRLYFDAASRPSEFELAQSTVALVWASPTANPTALPAGGFGALYQALGINDAGQIVGNGSNSNGGGNLIWASPSATPRLLPSNDGHTDAAVFAINDTGQLVGTSSDRVTPDFWASPTTNPTALPTGFESTFARGINDAGQIVGSSLLGNQAVALYWASPNSAPTVLPGGAFFSPQAFDINNRGQIVGTGFLASTGTVGLYWASPTSMPITLPRGGFTLLSQAQGINDVGQIVGQGSTGLAGFALFWATPIATPTALPSAGFTLAPLAQGINNVGQIVGRAVREEGGTTTLFWPTPSASPTQLANGSLGEGRGINDLGQAVGIALLPTSGFTAVLWPSPTTPPIALPSGEGIFAAAVNNPGQIIGQGVLLWTPG